VKKRVKSAFIEEAYKPQKTLRLKGITTKTTLQTKSQPENSHRNQSLCFDDE